jgi:hypothetical protein
MTKLKTLAIALLLAVAAHESAAVADQSVPTNLTVRTASQEAKHLARKKAACEARGCIFEIRAEPREDTKGFRLDYFTRCVPKKAK